MPKPTKFNFVSPDDELVAPDVEAVSINKNGSIIFMAGYAQKFAIDGKFIRFYIDKAKHQLGWVLTKTLDGFSEFKCSQYRPIKKSPAGVMQLSIRRILDKLEFCVENKPAHVPVEQYQDSMLGLVFHITVPHRKEALYLKDKKKEQPLGEFLADIHADNNQPDN
jgi:hypothetical protein